MKKILLLLFAFGSQGMADTTLISAPNPQKSWSASLVQNHPLFNLDSCVAEIQGTSSNGQLMKLQIVSSEHDSLYMEPVVYVSGSRTSSQELDFHIGDLVVSVNGSAKLYKTLPADLNPQSSVISGLISKVNDRKRLIADLSAGAKVSVTFLKEDRVVDRVDFSLSGSSAAYKKIKTECRFELN